MATPRTLPISSLMPHVVVTEDGRLAEKSVKKPGSIDDLLTTSRDIDEIFDTHLPAFIDKQGGGPVPLVVWAHGGLVNKKSGVGYAQKTADWWLQNGVYPVFMVWQSGGFSAITDAISGTKPIGARGVSDFTDRVLEALARGLGGVGVWDDMKLDAAACSVPERTGAGGYDGGGAWQFARALARFMKANPGAITVHAVGHSAGSIYHSHFVPAAIEAGVPVVDSVSLLAPAVRIDTFAKTLLPLADATGAARKITELSIFTMTDKLERDDHVQKAYRKSLLYLVSNSFEPEREAKILGMQSFLTKHDRTATYLRGNAERLVLSEVERDPRSASGSTSHGGFDNDALTMMSVARRIVGKNNLVAFPDPETSRSVLLEEPPAPTGGQDRALCIGVDAYPGKDALKGAVADAQAWGALLDSQGFSVATMVNAEATRANMVAGMIDLVGSSAAGDRLVIQFSGHGTFVPDLNGDEDDEHGAFDEAWCPVDFREGNLLIDDDLAPIWDLIPDDVSVTLLIDCCHSGSSSRAIEAPPTADSLARWVELTPEETSRFLEQRGAPVAEEWQKEARSRVISVEPGRARNTTKSRPAVTRREVTIAACQPDELAWENSGQGVFTRTALQVIDTGATHTNRSFVEAVVTALGSPRRQTPMLTADEPLANAPFLKPAAPGSESSRPGVPPHGPAVVDAAAVRSAAIVSILRATADLLEVKD